MTIITMSNNELGLFRSKRGSLRFEGSMDNDGRLFFMALTEAPF